MSTELTGIIFRQSVTMALHMAMGYLLFYHGKITAEESRGIAALNGPQAMLVFGVYLAQTILLPYWQSQSLTP